MKKDDEYGYTSLHCSCLYEASNAENALLDETLLNIFIQHGSADLLTQTNKLGKTPLQMFIAVPRWSQQRKEAYWNLFINAVMLINKSIELQIEGEYSIGGLFTSTSTQKLQDQIYHNWDNIVLPALERFMALPHGQRLPILQALIINKAPARIIKSTINRITESINTTDGLGMYPIDVAVRHGLSWDGEMNEVLESSNANLLVRKDVSTGLLPFMVAAVGSEKSNDVGAIFHLIQKTPLLLVSK